MWQPSRASLNPQASINSQDPGFLVFLPSCSSPAILHEWQGTDIVWQKRCCVTSEIRLLRTLPPPPFFLFWISCSRKRRLPCYGQPYGRPRWQETKASCQQERGCTTLGVAPPAPVRCVDEAAPLRSWLQPHERPQASASQLGHTLIPDPPIHVR